MLTEFTQLPDSSRIWIFQADQPFKKENIKIISEQLSTFLQQWTAHGSNLTAAFYLPYNHFVVVGLNQAEAVASGCSIDKLFQTLQSIGNKTNIDFFNRDLVAFREKNDVMLVHRKELKQRTSQWNGEMYTFNNLISAKSMIAEQWIVPAESTWLKRYLPQFSL